MSSFLSRLGRWRPVVGETHSQILLCYMGLMSLFIGVAVPCIYYLLFREVDSGVQRDLMDEVQEFKDFMALNSQNEPTELQGLIGQYLNEELAEPDQYFVFIINEKVYDHEPKDLPEALWPGSPLMKNLRMLKQSTQGEWISKNSQVGKISYKAEPIIIKSQFQGLFIIARTTVEERDKIDAIVRTVLLVMLIILVLAVFLAWLISGRILTPLRALALTARNITESDLSQRIPVYGTGELAEMTTTFNAMMDRLQAAFTSQQMFINDASHELRTPITIIQGHLDVMGDDPEEQRQTLDLVHEELDRMARFVNDMLMLVKAGRPDFIQPESVDLSVLMNSIYQKAKVITRCDCQLESCRQGMVYLDRERITQAIINLVENANQHTPVTGRISLGADLSCQEVRIWIRDTGKGIAPADQQRIFERFTRAANQARPSEGAGLGLSIVQAIAQASGGRIELQSALGQGSTFTLVLPWLQV